MRILPDGTVEIRNKKTGQTKIVSPQDLPNYGIPYSKFETELTAFKGTGGKTKAELTPIAKEKPTEGQIVRKNLATTGLKSIGNVEEIYRKDPNILN